MLLKDILIRVYFYGALAILAGLSYGVMKYRRYLIEKRDVKRQIKDTTFSSCVKDNIKDKAKVQNCYLEMVLRAQKRSKK